MFNPTLTLKSAFSSSLDELTSQYQIMLDMSEYQRDEYVNKSNAIAKDIIATINSEKTSDALFHLLKIKYILILKYKVFSGNLLSGDNGWARDRLCSDF